MDNLLSNYKVHSRQDFVKFIAALRTDFIENAEDWKNKNLSDFLAALESYSEDIQGYYDNTEKNTEADMPSWQTFADIFKGATMCE